MTLPKSGKGQSDRSVGFRAHSMTINLCDDIFTRYYFHKVRKRMSECFREAAKSLGYDRLKPEQERVLSEFMSGKDVFVALPTGYGKSLCYAALPLAFDLKKFGSIELKQSIVIVVSPLTALIKDQVASYSAKGLSVGCVTHETTSREKNSVREGKYQLLFFSPESLSKRQWFDQLQLEPYRSNIVALVIDEAHCVKKW